MKATRLQELFSFSVVVQKVIDQILLVHADEFTELVVVEAFDLIEVRELITWNCFDDDIGTFEDWIGDDDCLLVVVDYVVDVLLLFDYLNLGWLIVFD